MRKSPTHTHTQSAQLTPKQSHSHNHKHMHTQTHTYTHARTHTHTYTHIHTHTQTHTHIHTHTHTHAHTLTHLHPRCLPALSVGSSAHQHEEASTPLPPLLPDLLCWNCWHRLFLHLAPEMCGRAAGSAAAKKNKKEWRNFKRP